MKSRGFTLIELLAVIVILAIIALIATPIILNIISDARRGANERSVEMYAKAVQNAVATYSLKHPEDNNIKLYKLYKSYNGERDFIEYDGAEVDCDVYIYSTGDVYLTNCTVNGEEVLTEDSTEENKKYFSTGVETAEAHVGEKVNYTATGTNYSGQWRILGSENGQVLLLSDSVGTLTLQGADGWNNGISQINSMALGYDGGTKAVSSRSITVEDVNKLTGYNPYKTGDLTVSFEGIAKEYGNTVTYSYNNNDGKIYYQGTNGTSGTRIDKDITKFDSIDGINISSTNPANTISLKSTYYYYSIVSLKTTNKTDGDPIGLPLGSKEYKMISAKMYGIENTTTSYYWLANQDICTNESRTSWQMRVVWENTVNAHTLYHSFDAADAETPYTADIRVVVTLDASAKLVYDEANSIWNIE